MKIVSWNCNMAFRNKYEKVLAFDPDIIVVQECEHKEKLLSNFNTKRLTELLWFGDNPHKGIAILSFNNYSLKVSNLYNPKFKYIIPIEARVGSKEIVIFIIWAMPHATQRSKSYIGQIWGAVHYYEELLQRQCLLIGDFNSHVKWDAERKSGNHSDLVSFLLDREILSCYHELHGIQQGDERDPSWYMYKHLDKPYHLDYCFASKSLIEDMHMTIGQFKDWIEYSDHMPLFVSLSIASDI